MSSFFSYKEICESEIIAFVDFTKNIYSAGLGKEPDKEDEISFCCFIPIRDSFGEIAFFQGNVPPGLVRELCCFMLACEGVYNSLFQARMNFIFDIRDKLNKYKEVLFPFISKYYSSQLPEDIHFVPFKGIMNNDTPKKLIEDVPENKKASKKFLNKLMKDIERHCVPTFVKEKEGLKISNVIGFPPNDPTL